MIKINEIVIFPLPSLSCPVLFCSLRLPLPAHLLHSPPAPAVWPPRQSCLCLAALLCASSSLHLTQPSWVPPPRGDGTYHGRSLPSRWSSSHAFSPPQRARPSTPPIPSSPPRAPLEDRPFRPRRTAARPGERSSEPGIWLCLTSVWSNVPTLCLLCQLIYHASQIPNRWTLRELIYTCHMDGLCSIKLVVCLFYSQ